jgi:cell division transport system permease protein
MVSVSFMLAANLDYMLYQMGSSMGIAVYLQDGLTDEEIKTLRDKISEIPNVKHIEYVSSDAALDRFMAQLTENDPQTGIILNGLEDDNPLPASLVLTIENVSYWDSVEAALEPFKENGVESVALGKRTANWLMSINNVIRIISGILIIGLAIISIVIIFNTIRIAVTGRKSEINIMKYVGATDAFIRGPFIIEGAMIGLLGAAVPLIIAYPLYNPLINLLYNMLLMQGFQFRTHSYVFSFLISICVVLGAAIGIVGSVVSIRRHLKV